MEFRRVLFRSVHETVDPKKGERRSWQYTTGNTNSAPRVQRTSAVAYDNPQIYSDALSTADSFDVFSGPLDHYNWTELGKEERLCAYSSEEQRIGEECVGTYRSR